MRLLMIDNYDSFTWNLVQCLREQAVGVGSGDDLAGGPTASARGPARGGSDRARSASDSVGDRSESPSVEVVRNDDLTPDQLEAIRPDGVVLSPGPGSPDAAGVSVDAARGFARAGVPLLGVCLGHQAIARAFGARVAPASRVMHGKVSSIEHAGQGVFASLPNPFPATRYHSLAVDPASLPDCLEVTARSDDGEIMGLRHVELPIEGVQFHPESICTPDGPFLLRNFVMQCARQSGARARQSGTGADRRAAPHGPPQ